jgi:DegV family protein with EDD domain
VDSLSLSLGQGFQVLAAARAALAGLALDEVMRAVTKIRERSRLLILLDTVEFIRTGGRAAALMPVLNRVTKMLKIKPILGLTDGRLSLHSMARSYERGLAQIKGEIARLRPVESLAVVHTRSADVAHRVADALASKLGFPRQDVLVAETGPLLSTHAGPKVIGVVAVQQAL